MFDIIAVRERFGDFITNENNIFGGVQIVFNFNNGYGASLINHGGSYGNEIAVLSVGEDGTTSLCYDTPITDDVLGYLNNEEVIENLESIKNLKE